MGTFRYPVEVRQADGSHFEPVDAWVDTGASYTWMPRHLLRTLGYKPAHRRRFRLANGDVIESDLAVVWLRLHGETLPLLCVFGDEGSQPLLGATALGAFGLGPDPVNHTLLPIVSNALGAWEVQPIEELRAKAQAARAASRSLAKLSTAVKDRALLNIAEAVEARQEEVLAANEQDYRQSKKDGLSAALLDRLLLTPERLGALASDVRAVARLPDPVGETFDMRVLPNGLQIGRRRVPLGVVGSVYESRPNVTVDISALCLKSGNAVVLRGGKESSRSNKVLATLVREGIAAAGMPAEAVQFVESTDRALVAEMLRMREYIDLMVPRGGADFIRFVAENATMPVVAGGIGVCHTYVDGAADVEMARRIIHNAKVQRPSTCNALDTVLVDRRIAERALPAIAGDLASAGVELRCDPEALALLRERGAPYAREASPEDWGKEFLALVASVKVVDGLDGALRHIERYGSGHSEAIVTEDYSAAMRFVDEVDAAAVYVNASTRFTDGGQFGLGAEVGISTQKFHARGPMGLREMTSYKWVVLGKGQVRQ